MENYQPQVGFDQPAFCLHVLALDALASATSSAR